MAIHAALLVNFNVQLFGAVLAHKLVVLVEGDLRKLSNVAILELRLDRYGLLNSFDVALGDLLRNTLLSVFINRLNRSLAG